MVRDSDGGFGWALVAGLLALATAACRKEQASERKAAPPASRSATTPSSEPTASSRATQAVAPEDMILIPVTQFSRCYTMSYGEGGKCQPPVEVASFWLDRDEVTVADFAACVEAGVCPKAKLAVHHLCNWPQRAQRLNHPINCVPFAAAEAFCSWKQKRLPSGTEWERAARSDGRQYVWLAEQPPSDDEVFTLACWGRTSTCEIGSTPPWHPLGLRDMAGNVAEWTSDDAKSDPHFQPTVRGRNPAWQWRVAYGTSWSDPDYHDILSLLRMATAVPYAFEQGPSYRVGLRCARSQEP